MTKQIKTSKVQFDEFKKSFLHWQKEFGMMDYKVTFEHVKLKAYRVAEIGVNHESRNATVGFTSSIESDVAGGWKINAANHGMHEAIHLLLSRLSSVAFSRFVLERELNDAEEGIVRVLERILNPSE